MPSAQVSVDPFQPKTNSTLSCLLTSELLVVTRSSPFSFLDHFFNGLSDLRSGTDDVLSRKLVEGTSFLDVLESGFKVLEFSLDGFSGGFGLFGLKTDEIKRGKKRKKKSDRLEKLRQNAFREVLSGRFLDLSV